MSAFKLTSDLADRVGGSAGRVAGSRACRRLGAGSDAGCRLAQRPSRAGARAALAARRGVGRAARRDSAAAAHRSPWGSVGTRAAGQDQVVPSRPRSSRSTRSRRWPSWARRFAGASCCSTKRWRGPATRRLSRRGGAAQPRCGAGRQAGRAGGSGSLDRHWLPSPAAHRRHALRRRRVRIPAAALAAEDAELLHRRLQGGESCAMRLRLSAKLDGEVDSWNVVGEVPGRERPDEIVLLGAHLDSWDLGSGALDDGAGVAWLSTPLVAWRRVAGGGSASHGARRAVHERRAGAVRGPRLCRRPSR